MTLIMTHILVPLSNKAHIIIGLYVVTNVING